MTTYSLVAKVAEQIATEIDDARSNGDFVLNDFTTTWDFLGRLHETDLSDTTFRVTVFCPIEYSNIEWFTTSKQVRRVAAWYVQVRKKVGTAGQTTDLTPIKDQVDKLVQLTEQLHDLFVSTITTLTVGSYQVLWLYEDESVDGPSMPIELCQPGALYEDRLFLSTCREIFQVADTGL